MRICAAILIALSVTVSAHAEPDNHDQFVAVRRIETQSEGSVVAVRVFYPTKTVAQQNQFGPWRLKLAKNADPLKGVYPLIVISHGLGGNDWNHHLLAQELVARGFVVAAMRHPEDLLRVGRPQQVILRPLEVGATLDAVLNHPNLGKIIDPTRIGGFGFSLGGFSILAAAGGKVDLSQIGVHCKTAEHDPQFCMGEKGGAALPLWLRLRRLVYSVPQVELSQDTLDHRLKALVLAAPVGLPFVDLTRVEVPVMVIRAGDDQELRFPYHAEKIHNLLSQHHRYKVIENLHHYAFLSPFPMAIVDEVEAPARDPIGFDRLGFLKTIHDEIADFFTEQLQ